MTATRPARRHNSRLTDIQAMLPNESIAVIKLSTHAVQEWLSTLVDGNGRKITTIAPETLLAVIEPMDSTPVDLRERPMKQATHLPR